MEIKDIFSNYASLYSIFTKVKKDDRLLFTVSSQCSLNAAISWFWLVCLNIINNYKIEHLLSDFVYKFNIYFYLKFLI